VIGKSNKFSIKREGKKPGKNGETDRQAGRQRQVDKHENLPVTYSNGID